MALCNIIDDPARTQEQYEQISAHVRSSGPVLPDGCRLALLGRERAITVWDTPEQRDRFLAERVGPAYEAVGRSLPAEKGQAATVRQNGSRAAHVCRDLLVLLLRPSGVIDDVAQGHGGLLGLIAEGTVGPPQTTVISVIADSLLSR